MMAETASWYNGAEPVSEGRLSAISWDVSAWCTLGLALGLSAPADVSRLTPLWAMCAALAAVAAAAGQPYGWQLATFATAAGVSWVWARRHVGTYLRRLQDAAELDNVVGRPGIVTKAIHQEGELGEVRVGSTFWPARADTQITVGTEVEVDDLLDGVVTVRPSEGGWH